MLDVVEEKISIRYKYRNLRYSIDECYANYVSEVLIDNYLENFFILDGEVIAGYRPVDKELNVLPLMNLLSERNKKILVPVRQHKEKLLLFKEYDGCNFIIPDIVIVPLIAFDISLNRLGFGGGYYDSTISQLRKNGCKFIGVGYEIQRCDNLPVERHDQKLDFIITESGVYKN